MNPIIEAAAKARWEYVREVESKFGFHDLSWDDLASYSRKREINGIRAALRAMAECEPTTTMYERWMDNGSNPQYSRTGMIADWRALLLAAAEE